MTKPRNQPSISLAAVDGETIAGGERHLDLVEQLFRSSYASLVRYLEARLRSDIAAQEVAQEAFFRVLSCDRIGDVGELRAYVFRTASNIAIDRYRKTATEWRLNALCQAEEATEIFSPERSAAAAQKLAFLPKVLGELPAKCRKAFLLYTVEERDYRDIAEQMTLSERMVRIYVRRAVDYCRSRLDELSEDGRKQR